MSENINGLTDHQKLILRAGIINKAIELLGVKYYLGAEWTDYSKKPEALDCSELVEGCYVSNGLKMPDGSQNQFNFTIPVPIEKAQFGDLAFFGKGGDTSKIYHVGLVYDEINIIEARGFQPESKFKTGEVILRVRSAWEKYSNFVGYRSHPKLV